jgi:hypothetical protein
VGLAIKGKQGLRRLGQILDSTPCTQEGCPRILFVSPKDENRSMQVCEVHALKNARKYLVRRMELASYETCYMKLTGNDAVAKRGNSCKGILNVNDKPETDVICYYWSKDVVISTHAMKMAAKPSIARSRFIRCVPQSKNY